MVMTGCLMVYAALEHKIRRKLKAQSAYFPNLKYKPCQNPTARWVFFCFQGGDVLIVNGEQQLVLNVEERNRTVLSLIARAVSISKFIPKSVAECRFNS
jgi:transposase